MLKNGVTQALLSVNSRRPNPLTQLSLRLAFYARLLAQGKQEVRGWRVVTH